MKPSKDIILSLSDFIHAIKKGRKGILISAALCGCFFFCYKVQKPICYTAVGTFKSRNANSVSGFSQAIESLAGGSQEKYSGADDPRYFLASYPVLKNVIYQLGLQGTIHEVKHPSRFQRILFNIRAEKAQKLGPPPSLIASSRGAISDHYIIPDFRAPITCHQIDYPLEISKTLKIQFSDANHYKVFAPDSRKAIGNGMLDAPFIWDGGNFTLKTDRTNLAKKTFHLTLVPIEKIVGDLSKQLQVKKDKENAALIYLKYQHTNRHLAAAIVNKTMEEFQNYLKDEGKKKAANQLTYLKKRQDDSLADLEAIMETHREDLEKHLGSGGMLSLNQELEFLAREQSSYQAEMSRLALEMKRLYQSLHGKEIPLGDLLQSVKTLPIQSENEIQALSLESADHLLSEHQKRLDHTQIELEHYNYALEKFEDPLFDCSSLSQIIEDSMLRSHFEKLNSLHHNLVDVKNWSSKEREALLGEIDIEKAFLKKHILHLKDGGIVKAEVAQSRIHSLQYEILKLLSGRYEAVQESLRNLAFKVSDFPQKWLAEQKIELNKKIHTEIIESITKMIEAKNIAYHMEHLSSSPFQFASNPVIPNSPKLLFFFIVGFVLGAFFSIMYLIFREIYHGPSATLPNFSTKQSPILGIVSNPSPHEFQQLKKRDLKTIRALAYFASQKQILLITSQSQSSFPNHFLSFLANKGERNVCLDTERVSENCYKHINESSLESSLIKEKNWDLLPLGDPTHYQEEIFENESFQLLFNKLKSSYKQIIIWNCNHPKSIETQFLSKIADQTIYLVSQERLHELNELPADTAYIFQKFHKVSTLNLASIKPFLDRVKKRVVSSFSSLQDSLNNFSKNR